MNRLDAIYARQSIDKADSISIESQIEYCRYETKGAPCRVYADRGYSGKSTQRPQFLAMLAAVRQGEIKRVICYKLDRCSRSILDFTKLMDEFQRWGVEFVSCTEKFDTSTPMGRAMLNICIIFAQLERETIQQRISDAYHSRCKRGFFMGGRVPFGFRLEPCLLDGRKTARYVQVSEEAQILERMYGVYQHPCASLADVVLALREAGIRNPRRDDGLWVRSHIGRMLQNPIYVKADLSVYQYYSEQNVEIHNSSGDFLGGNGCYLFGKDSNPQLVLAPHEGIIPAEIWLRCMQKRSHRGAPRKKAASSWLVGKIQCGKCGYCLAVRQRQGKKIYRYLVCPHATGNGKICQGVRGIHADRVEEILFQRMKLAAEGITLKRIQQDPREQEVRALCLQAEHEIRQLVTKSTRVSTLTAEVLDRRIQELTQQMEQYRAQMEKCQPDMPAATAATCLDRWDHFSVQEKRTVLDALVEKIQITETQITIFWRL